MSEAGASVNRFDPNTRSRLRTGVLLYPVVYRFCGVRLLFKDRGNYLFRMLHARSR
jgi:hypothetical protein